LASDPTTWIKSEFEEYIRNESIPQVPNTFLMIFPFEGGNTKTIPLVDKGFKDTINSVTSKRGFLWEQLCVTTCDGRLIPDEIPVNKVPDFVCVIHRKSDIAPREKFSPLPKSLLLDIANHERAKGTLSSPTRQKTVSRLRKEKKDKKTSIAFQREDPESIIRKIQHTKALIDQFDEVYEKISLWEKRTDNQIASEVIQAQKERKFLTLTRSKSTRERSELVPEGYDTSRRGLTRSLTTKESVKKESSS